MRDPCPRCQQTHERCTAHRQDGGPCGMRPATGADVCRMHGGSAVQVRRAAERRRAEEAAEALLRRHLHVDDAPEVRDYVREFARLGGALKHAIRAAGGRVNELDGLTGVDDKGSEYVRGEVLVWRELLGMYRQLITDGVKLGIDARTAKFEGVVADLLAEHLHALRADLDTRLRLDDDERREVDQALEQMLRSLAEAEGEVTSGP